MTSRLIKTYALTFGTNEIDMPIGSRILDAVIGDRQAMVMVSEPVDLAGLEIKSRIRTVLVAADGAQVEVGRWRHLRSGLIEPGIVQHVFERFLG